MNNKITENYSILLYDYIFKKYGCIKTLSKDEKREFAYNYHRMFNEVPIIEILEASLDNKKVSNTIFRFIRLNYLTKTTKSLYEAYSNGFMLANNKISKATYNEVMRDYDYNNWLEEYNEEVLFNENDRVKKPVFSKFIKSDGSILTIDKEKATLIKNILKENDIFPSKYLVESAFRYYAADNMDEYIKDIKKNKIDVKKISTKYQVKHMPTTEDGINLVNLIKKNPVKLTSSDKILFACQYYDTLGNVSLIDVLKNNVDDINLRKTIVKFISINNMKKINPNCGLSDFSLYNVTRNIKSFNILDYEYDYQNWLEEYDEDIQFEIKNKMHPSINSILLKDGTSFTVDKEMAKKIKLSLIDEGIFPAVCIVKGAFKPIAENNFKQYVKTLKKRGDENE